MLQIVYAPNEIFRKKAAEVEKVDDQIRELIDQMLDTMRVERAVGLGANMVGLLKRIIVLDLQVDGVSNPVAMVNPEIIYQSDVLQEIEEASISFPGISALIKRPAKIKVKYLDYNSNDQEMEADGFLATVIQHEIDYLDGIVYLDHLSKMKRDLLLKKMQKFIKQYPPHVHGQHCHH